MTSPHRGALKRHFPRPAVIRGQQRYISHLPIRPLLLLQSAKCQQRLFPSRPKQHISRRVVFERFPCRPHSQFDFPPFPELTEHRRLGRGKKKRNEGVEAAAEKFIHFVDTRDGICLRSSVDRTSPPTNLYCKVAQASIRLLTGPNVRIHPKCII